MVSQDWYRDLARINRQIAHARELIERQGAYSQPDGETGKRDSIPRYTQRHPAGDDRPSHQHPKVRADLSIAEDALGGDQS